MLKVGQGDLKQEFISKLNPKQTVTRPKQTRLTQVTVSEYECAANFVSEWD